jgi:hypothetical protein
MLPWSDGLMAYQDELNQLRQPFLDTCKAIYNRAETLNDKLNELGIISFQQAVIEMASNEGMPSINWNCIEGDKTVTINSMGMDVHQNDNGTYQIKLTDDLYSWIETNSKTLAERLKAALTVHTHREMGRVDLLQMPIPKNDVDLEKFKAFVLDYDNGNALGKLEALIDRIDEIVAQAFSMTDKELLMIQKQMHSDSFLKNIKPSLPYTRKKKRGLLTGLNESSRYL